MAVSEQALNQKNRATCTLIIHLIISYHKKITEFFPHLPKVTGINNAIICRQLSQQNHGIIPMITQKCSLLIVLIMPSCHHISWQLPQQNHGIFSQYPSPSYSFSIKRTQNLDLQSLTPDSSDSLESSYQWKTRRCVEYSAIYLHYVPDDYCDQTKIWHDGWQAASGWEMGRTNLNDRDARLLVLLHSEPSVTAHTGPCITLRLALASWWCFKLPSRSLVLVVA